MTLPSVPSYTTLRRLNQIGFDTIWSSPRAHMRANFQLSPYTARYAISSIVVDETFLPLPKTATTYRVYHIGSAVYWGLVPFPTLSWVSACDIAKMHNVDILTYDQTGRIVDPAYVYLCYVPYLNMVLTAIDVATLTACTDSTESEIYQTFFRDATPTTQFTCDTFTIPQASITVDPQVTITSIVALLTRQTLQNKDGIWVVVNGRPYTVDTYPTLTSGDRVNVLFDPDIVGTVTFTVDDQTTGYYSTVFGEYRELLHIPKALNPDNLILSSSDITALIRDPVSGKSIYLHRIAAHGVAQVTHNDFTISRQVLNAFRDVLGVSQIEIVLGLRLPSEHKPMMTDAAHLIDLYRLDDPTIISHLLGLIDVGIPEWHCASLESSTFLTLIRSTDRPLTPDLLTTYVAALGYYRTAALLAQSRATYTVTGSAIGVDKPVGLNGYPCDAIVYWNGRKLSKDVVACIERDCRTFYVDFLNGAPVKPGDRIDLHITEGGDRTPQAFIPSAQTPSIDLSTADVAIYREIQLDTPAVTYTGTSDTAYRLTPPSAQTYTLTTDNTGTHLVFTEACYGQTYLIAPLTGMETMSFPLDALLARGTEIVCSLEHVIGERVYPCLTGGSFEVYLNGYRLVEGIDYTHIPNVVNTQDLVSRDIVIANMTYLDLTGTGNLVEVVVSSDIPVSSDAGYGVNGVFVRNNAPMLWDASCGRLFSRGLLMPDVTDCGPYLMTTTAQYDGVPFSAIWSMPYWVFKLLATAGATQDSDLCRRIDLYLGRTLPTPPQFVKITSPYILYSPFLTRVISDLVSGVFVAGQDPSDTLFLEQFSGYDYLLARDPIIGQGNTLINRNYVDLAASYRNQTITKLDLLQITQRLVKLLFNNKAPTLGVSLK